MSDLHATVQGSSEDYGKWSEKLERVFRHSVATHPPSWSEMLQTELDRVLGVQIARFQELLAHQQILQHQLDSLAEKHDDLCQTVHAKGVITREDLVMQRERMRCAALVKSGLQTPAIVGLLSEAAGLDAVRAFAATSPFVKQVIFSSQGSKPFEKQASATPSSTASTSSFGLLGRIFYRREDPQNASAGSLESSQVSTSDPAVSPADDSTSDETADDTPAMMLDDSAGKPPSDQSEPRSPPQKHYGLFQRLFYTSAETPEDVLPAELNSQDLPAIGVAAGVAASRKMVAVSKAWADSLHSTRAMLEASRQPAMYVCGGSIGLTSATAERFNFALGAWEELPAMSMPRRRCALAATGGMLYVVGGCDDFDVTERFDPDAGQWEPLPGMIVPISHGAAAAAGGCIYTFGGLSQGKVVSAVQQFNPAQYEWKQMPPLETPRFDCAAISVDGMLYVMGGASGFGNPLALCESLDPVMDKWKSLPSMISSRHGCAAAHSNGMIYVCGGGDALTLFAVAECFDRLHEIWVPLPPMPVPRKCCGAVELAGRVYVCGGITDSAETSASVDCFDPHLSTWEEGTPVQTMRSYCAAASVLP